jgi:hypothetical protein
MEKGPQRVAFSGDRRVRRRNGKFESEPKSASLYHQRSMYDTKDEQWLNERLREKSEQRKKNRLRIRTPGLTVIDASKFSQQIADLAVTLSYKVDREGPSVFGSHPMQGDISAILLQLRETYNLLRFVNGDETRDENLAYRMSYSFVSLPLIRTMIDGFYNCTALFDDPSRVRQFRISGLYRIRESIQADEQRYGDDPQWKQYLAHARRQYEGRLRLHKFTDVDLNDKKNKWPLLGVYLDAKPDTPHKQMLRKLTLGFWKEYSSISHSSYDGIMSIFHFIATERAEHEMRPIIREAAERHITVHVGRAAGLLLCLATEVQHFCKFDGANIDQRISDMWAAIWPVVEVRDLFDYRYKALLRIPMTAPATPTD